MLCDLENLLDFKSKAFQILVDLSLCSWSSGSLGPWLSVCPQEVPQGGSSSSSDVPGQDRGHHMSLH